MMLEICLGTVWPRNLKILVVSEPKKAAGNQQGLSVREHTILRERILVNKMRTHAIIQHT